jgi:hypothetical protein
MQIVNATGLNLRNVSLRERQMAMSVKRLRAAIDQIASILQSAGAGNQSKNFSALSSLLEGNDEKSLPEFFAVLSAPTVPATVSGDGINRYIRRIEEAGTDEVGFSFVMSELLKDKAIRKADVDAIASGYTKGRSKWPTKRDGIKAIEATFRERAYQAVKMRQVEKASKF